MKVERRLGRVGRVRRRVRSSFPVDFKMATSAVSTTDRFYFTKEQLQNTPSRKNGVDPEKEQSYRQQAATLIQDMGQRLSVYPLQKLVNRVPFLVVRLNVAQLLCEECG